MVDSPTMLSRTAVVIIPLLMSERRSAMASRFSAIVALPSKTIAAASPSIGFVDGTIWTFSPSIFFSCCAARMMFLLFGRMIYFSYCPFSIPVESSCTDGFMDWPPETTSQPDFSKSSVQPSPETTVRTPSGFFSIFCCFSLFL